MELKGKKVRSSIPSSCIPTLLLIHAKSYLGRIYIDVFSKRDKWYPVLFPYRGGPWKCNTYNPWMEPRANLGISDIQPPMKAPNPTSDEGP